MTDTPEVTQADREAAALSWSGDDPSHTAMGRQCILEGKADNFALVQAFAAHREQSTAALQAEIEPVLHWYQSDEHSPRPLQDIVRDIVADLQSDRKDLPALQAENARLRERAERLLEWWPEGSENQLASEGLAADLRALRQALTKENQGD